MELLVIWGFLLTLAPIVWIVARDQDREMERQAKNREKMRWLANPPQGDDR